MLLVASGCSHTYGEELGTTKTECNTNSYAGILAKRLGFDYLNIAVGASSNEMIAHNTVEFLLNYTGAKDQLFVVIGWTTTNRKIVFNEYGTFHLQQAKYARTIPWEDRLRLGISDETIKEMETYYSLWLTFEYNQTELNRNFIHQILYLGNFLNSLRVKYLMLNMVDPLPESPIKSEIDKLVFLKPSSFNGTLRCTNSNRPLMPRKHFCLEAHDQYSNLISNYIKYRNLI